MTTNCKQLEEKDGERMGIHADLAAYSARLDAAIRETMETEVADAAKAEIGTALDQYDFPQSRGFHGGGLLDLSTLEATTEQVGDETTLTVQSGAVPQEIPAAPGVLATAVTEGWGGAWRMPKERPFMKPAERQLGGGAFGAALKKGLQARGFSVDIGGAVNV